MELKQGYKQTEVGVIPEDWGITELGKIGVFSKGSGVRKDQSNSGEIACVRYGELYTKHNNYIKTFHSFISKEVSLQAKKLKKGDILFAGSGETKAEIGKSAAFIDDIEAYAGGDIVILTPKEFDSLYLGYLLNASFVQAQKASRGQGDAVVHISSNNLSSIKIPQPTLKEQTAIANALSDMDALISQTEKLIEKKKAIKQGAMQELLKPKDGWVTKKLGEIIHLQGGYAFKSEQFTEVGVPIIRISDVGNNEVKTENSVCYKEFNIPPEFVARKGDTLIAMSGATTGKVGVYNHSKIAYINQRVGKFIVINKNSTSNEFISHIVRSEKFKDNLSKQIAQGAQPNISGKQIESIEMSIPNNYQTQVIIASILSDIDKSIAFLELKLNKLKQQKQGMMQTLLTGKIRLVS